MNCEGGHGVISFKGPLHGGTLLCFNVVRLDVHVNYSMYFAEILKYDYITCQDELIRYLCYYDLI